MEIGLREETSVLEGFRRRFLADLRARVFLPGQKLPGERDLAKRYGLGRSSVTKVLRELQEERYLERIPIRGTFIRADLPKRVEPVRLVLASTDTSLSEENYDMFSWERISELLRGLLYECGQRPGVSIVWHYCPPTDDEDDFKRQCEDLAEADGVAFLGERQERLKENFLLTGKPAVVVVPPRPEQQRYPVIGLDTRHLGERYVRILTSQFPGRDFLVLGHEPESVDIINHEETEREMKNTFALCGVKCDWLFLPGCHASHDEWRTRIGEHWPEISAQRGRVILVMNRSLLLPLLDFPTREGGLEIVAFRGGNSMRHLHPAVFYLHEPYFAIGREVIRALSDAFREHRQPTGSSLPPVLHFGEKCLEQLDSSR